MALTWRIEEFTDLEENCLENEMKRKNKVGNYISWSLTYGWHPVFDRAKGRRWREGAKYN
jgi:hypothetical protein